MNQAMMQMSALAGACSPRVLRGSLGKPPIWSWEEKPARGKSREAKRLSKIRRAKRQKRISKKGY